METERGRGSQIIFKISELKEYLGNYGRFGYVSIK